MGGRRAFPRCLLHKCGERDSSLYIYSYIELLLYHIYRDTADKQLGSPSILKRCLGPPFFII